MNHIYKSIFNKALGVFTAVPEFASAHGKGSERTVVGRVAKGTAGFAASALAISIGLALTSTSAVAGPGIYINDGTDKGCFAIPDATIPNVGIHGIVGGHIRPELSVLGASQVLPPDSYYGLDSMTPCYSSVGGSAMEHFSTQTNRTLFYGKNLPASVTDNGAKNLTLGGRLDVNSGIIGVGDRGVNGTDATNSIRMGTGTTLDNANKKVNTIAVGVNASTPEDHGIAIGEQSAASGVLGSLAIGKNAVAAGPVSLAQGTHAYASDRSGVAIGEEAKSSGIGHVAMGFRANAQTADADKDDTPATNKASYGVTIGHFAGSEYTGTDNVSTVAIGNKAGQYNTGGDRNVQIGDYSGRYVNGSHNVAIGSSAGSGTNAEKLEASETISIGRNSKASAAHSTAIGSEAKAKGIDSIAMGLGAIVEDAAGFDGIAIGTRAKAKEKGMAVGAYSQANGVESGVFANAVQGKGSTASGRRSSIIGVESTVSGNNSVSIGDTNTVASARTYAIGNNINAAAGTDDSLVFGTRASVGGNNSIAMGNTATASGHGSVAISNQSKAKTTYSIALGEKAVAGDDSAGALNNGEAAIAIGREASANVYNGIALGKQATVKKDSSDGIAIGSETKVNAYKGTAIGAFSEANGSQALAIGNNKQGQSSVASGEHSQVIGVESNVSGQDSTAIGYKNTVASARTYAMGNNINAAAGTDDSLAFGTRAAVEGANTIAMGNTAKALTDSSISIGQNAESGKVDKFDGKKSIAIGYEAKSMGTSTIAMGYNAKSENGHDGVSIGTYAKSDNEKTITIGSYSSASGAQSIVIANNYNSDNSFNSDKSTATGRRAIVMGAESHATAEQALAIGDKNTVAAARTYAIGNNINIDNTNAVDSLAFGTSANVKGQDQISIGHNAGADAVATAKNAYGIALGLNAGRYQQGGEDNYAIGQNAGQYVNGTHSVALGLNAGSHIEGDGNFAAADGAGNYIKGRNNIAIGNNAGSGAAGAIVEADRTISVGTRTQARGNNAIAIGTDSKGLARNTTAIGQGAEASANFGMAMGSSANSSAENAIAVGNGATAANANSVALGAGSATDAPHNGDYTLNGSYTAAGLPVAANGTVSVGSAGKERQIQNVAAGVISATSTDAINGSQLYATNNYLSNLATGVQNVLGGDAAVDNAGNLTMSNIGGTGKGNVHEAIAAVKGVSDTAVQEVESENPTALSVKKDGTKVTLTPNFIAGDLVNPDGTVNAPTTDNEGKLVSAKTVADALKANHFVVDTKANGGTVDASVSEENAKVGSGNKVTFEAGKNLVAQQTNTANGGATVKFSLQDEISLKKATVGEGANQVVLGNDGVKVGDSTLNAKGLTINNGPSVTDVGIDAGNKKITGVDDGNVAAGSKDAVNGGQLAAVKAKADTAVQDVKSGDDKALSVTRDANTNVVTVTPKLSGDLVDADGNISKLPTPEDKGKLVTAGTVAEALANTHFVVNTEKTDGGELDTASQANQKIKASNKVTLQAGKNLKAKQTNSIDGAKVEFSLKDSISLKEVKVGEGSANEVVLNDKGVNVAGNTYINKDGLNANGNKVANVKAGDVSATSTDAVNGAQLHNVATSVANVLGGNAAVDGNGNVTSSNIGGTGANTVDDAIKAVNATAAKHTTVVAGKNVKVTKDKNAAGGDEYTVATKDDLEVTSVTAGNTTVNNNGLTITSGPSVTRGGIDAGNRVISDVKAGDVSATSKEAVNGSQLHATNTKLDGVKAKADTAVQDVKSGDENALTAVKDPNTNIVTVTPKLSGDLVDTNGNITAPTTPEEKGKLVTAGTVAEALANTHFVVDTLATTGGELDSASKHDQKIKASNKVTLQAGKNLKAKQTNAADGATVEFSLKDSISLKEVTAGEGANQVVLNDKGVNIGGNTYINNDGLNANGNKITNVADGVDPKDAVNKSQLDAVKGVADSAVKSVKAADGEENLVVDNADPKNPKLSLKKDLTADSLTLGDKAGDHAVVNKDGLTIAGGPSVKKDGIDAGDKKITNVAAGDVAENSKDAVNGGQLHNVAKGVADVLGGDAAVDGDGKVTMTNIGETGKGNVNDAIKHVNDAAKAAADTAKKHTTVEQGDNIVVEESTNAEGGKHYKVSTAKNLNVDSVKAGDTTVNNDGVTINNGPSMTKDGINANNTKVTNVADGVDAADAVNKGQLDKVDTKVSNVAQNVVNVLGGDATVNGNGDITMSNIGETGKGNINDAIKSVNDLAKKAAAEKTSVKAKEGRSNVTVTEGVNAAGGHEYTVDVERSVTNAGSDYVTVTNNHDADTNTTTYTVDVSAKTKASLAKADSAVQGLTSKDGNLNFTKGANGNVEVSFNDNLNVKNVTTDRVQVANGPSMSKDGINAAGKAISNVANGNVAADSKDAVNGGQLHETAKSVADVIGGGATVKDGKVVAGQNGIGNTGQNTVHGAIAAINQNTANNFNQIRGDLRKMDRDLRGGIAGALATAGLPQAFRPGKSMVAAAASTYRGQSGLAIGVSRISDNGKIILKVTGNTNSRGDFGGTIGAGYQW